MTTIITCAVTGAHTKKSSNPHLPVTPQEIAVSALEAADAGAAVIHIHVRDPDTAGPSMRMEYYQEVVETIRDHNREVLINLTTGPGATGPANAVHTGSDLFRSAKERVAHVLHLRPDICSLDFNTMNRGTDQITVNSLPMIKHMAQLIYSAGVKPELEIFDSGDMMVARDMIEKGDIKAPALIQIATGVKWGWPSVPDTLTFARSLLPADCEWYAFGIGRWQMPFVALSYINGGHARVGFEDNIFISPRVLARSNREFVIKARRVIEDLGGRVASPIEARRILDLPHAID